MVNVDWMVDIVAELYDFSEQNGLSDILPHLQYVAKVLEEQRVKFVVDNNSNVLTFRKKII